jgi:pyruvate kinase
VMLNKGPYLPEAVAFLRDVLARMDRHQSKKFARFTPLRAWG